MYFTVNLAFVNYFDDAIEDLGIPILKKIGQPRNKFDQFQYKPLKLAQACSMPPKTLKELVSQYKNKQRILEIKGQKEIEEAKTNSKFGSFLKSFLVDILLFTAALVTMIIILTVIYMMCGQSKLKALVANIALQCIKAVEVAGMTDRYCICKPNWYIIGILLIIMLGIIYLVALTK